MYEMNGSETKAKLTVKSFVVFDLTSNRYRMIRLPVRQTMLDTARARENGRTKTNGASKIDGIVYSYEPVREYEHSQLSFRAQNEPKRNTNVKKENSGCLMRVLCVRMKRLESIFFREFMK